MTKEEWKKVDIALTSVFAPPVNLKIDGYKVSLNLTQKSRFQNAILVYVNDEFRGKWLAQRIVKSAEDFIAVKSGQLSPKRITNFTEFVARKLSRNLKISLVTMSIVHTGQTLRK